MLRLRASEAQVASIEQTAKADAMAELSCDAQDASASTFPAIDTYVAELGAGLHSACSTGLATGTCEEIRQHLVAMTDALIELGESAEEAERQALVRFGSIGKHRRALAGELRRTARRANPQAAFRFALALYGGVCALELLGMFLFALVAQASFYHLLPFWQLYCCWMLCGSPLITGCIAGRQTGRLAVRATSRAQVPIIGSLLLASGVAYLAVLGVYLLVMGKEVNPSNHWLVGFIFGFACYHVVRFPISLATAWLSGKPRRRSLPLAKG